MKTRRTKLWWVFVLLTSALPIHAQDDSTDKSPHKGGFVTVNGVKLHYLDWSGRGEALLFLHGQGDTAHRYDDFAPRFTNQFRVLGLTRRSHGESEIAETGYDTLTLVEDVRQFLDALRIQRVVLAGHSFAGDEVTRFAVMYPDRVIKLIYFDSAFDHSRVPETLRFKPLHGWRPGWLPTKEESELPEGRRRWVSRYFGEQRGPAMYSMMEGTYSERHEYGKIKAPALAFFAIGYQKEVDSAETLPEPHRQEVLGFLKAQRKYHGQEIEHFRREIPNGRVIVFTNAPHQFPFDREDDVLREMREFLGKPDAAGEPEPVLTDPAIQQILQQRISGKKAVGLVVGRLEGTNRSIVAAGTMSLTNSRPVAGDTLFELGSITKVFTGILLGDMANRGEVRPDDPATKYLPPTVKMPSRNGHVITLAHLASHRSGLPAMPENLAPADSFANYSLEQGFEFLSRYELPRDPGSAYEYSNFGLGLLGDLLARRADTNYEQLVLDRICRPLGMNDTRIKLSPEMQGRFARGHDDGLNPVKHLEFLGFAGAGALRSTANDFLKFLAVALHPRDDRLSKAILRSQAARTNTVGPGGAGPGGEVAWCWYFNTLSDEIIFHSGMTAGFHGYMGVNRKRDRAVVVFSNCSRSIDDIALHLLEPRNELIPYGKAIVLDQTALERYVGTYAVTPTLELVVSREKNKIYIQPPHESKAEIFALTENQFFCEGPARFSFKTNASGMVTELIVRQGGKDYRAVRR